MKFYIWAKKYSTGMVRKFWNKGSAGYTIDLEYAEEYTEEEIESRSIPVLCEENKLQLMYSDYKDIAVPVNEIEDLLGRKMTCVLN